MSPEKKSLGALAPTDSEADPKSTEEVIRTLEALGLGTLTHLLDLKHEADFLRKAISWASTQQEKEGYHPFINLAPQVSTRVVSPEDMYGFCGKSTHAKTEYEIVPTPIGKSLVALSDLFPGLFIIEIDGAAADSTRSKPFSALRDITRAASFNPSRVSMGLMGSEGGAPPPDSDIDVLMITQDTALTEEVIAKALKRGPLSPKKGARVDVVRSIRRKFTRIQINFSIGRKIKLQNPSVPKSLPSVAQLAFAERSGVYSNMYSLIDFVLSRADLPHPVVVISSKDKRDRISRIFGAEIDFYGIVERARLRFEQAGKHRFLLPLVYVAPYFAFPEKSVPEKMEHFFHAFRTWAWGNYAPIVNHDNLPIASIRKLLRTKEFWKTRRLKNQIGELDEEISHEFRFGNTQRAKDMGYKKELLLIGLSRATSPLYPEEILARAKRAAEWFAENIIEPISSSPDLLGDRDAQVANSIRLLQSLSKAFDGDGLVTLIRCLEKGQSYGKVPAWGMDIFSERGFFPKMGSFLSGNGRKEKLLTLFEKSARNYGWRVLVDFLLTETNGNLGETANLLTPCIYPGGPKDLAKVILGKLDSRFIELAEAKEESRIPLREHILTMLLQTSYPLFEETIVLNLQRLGITHSPAYLFQVLDGMRRDGLVIDLSLDPILSGLIAASPAPCWGLLSHPEIERMKLNTSFSDLSRIFLHIVKGSNTRTKITADTGIDKETLGQLLEILFRNKIISGNRIFKVNKERVKF